MNASRIENAGSPEFFLWGVGAITAAQASIFALDCQDPNAIYGPLLKRVRSIANERAEKIASALNVDIHNPGLRFIAIGIDESLKTCQELLQKAGLENRSPRFLLVNYRASLSYNLSKRLEIPLLLKYPHQEKNIRNTISHLVKEDNALLIKLQEMQRYEYNS